MPNRLLSAFVVVIMMAGCVGIGGSAKESGENALSQTDGRQFLMGMVPTPENFPNSSIQEIEDGYTLASTCCELVNLWLSVPWWEEEKTLSSQGTRALLNQWIYGKGLTPIFHTNFWSLHFVSGYGLAPKLDIPPGLPENTTMGSARFRERWIQHAVNISAAYHPKYFCLGNEVDSFYIYEPNRPDFDNYTSLVAETYDAIKEVSSETKIIVVFRLVDLYDKDNFFLINKFDKDKIDLFGFTTYPYLNQSCTDPGKLPDNYYTHILDYTGEEQIAFTEIGWSSSSLSGGSEEEQADYLAWFMNHTAEMPVKIVCWLDLHDRAIAGTESNANELVGLRRNDGTEKAVWSEWVELYSMPYENNPPSKPERPAGETKGKTGEEYRYTTSSTDYDGDTVYYMWDWGDGSYSNWLGPFSPGNVVNATHSWSKKSSYEIRVKAKDFYGEESDWSDPLAVSIPKFYGFSMATSYSLRFFGRELFPGLADFSRYSSNLLPSLFPLHFSPDS